MRGKKPKERNQYIIRLPDGTLVRVTREVYLEWYQSKRRERYQRERDKKHNLCSLDTVMYQQKGMEFEKRPEDLFIQKLCLEKLWGHIRRFPEQDQYLIQKIYFEKCPMTELARKCRCTTRTIQNRKNRLLGSLQRKLLNDEIDIECLRLF